MNITLPFRIASPDAPLLMLSAMVNGQGPFEFVLDTGNGAPIDMLISQTLQQRLGLVEAQGSFPVPTVSLDTLEVGEWKLQGVPALTHEAMDQIGARIGVAVSGNVGFHLLHHWRVEVDYAASVIRLSRDGAAEDGADVRDGGDGGKAWDAKTGTEDGTPFESGPGGAFILLPVRVNDRGPFTFLVDTGASITALSPRLARELGLSGESFEALGAEGQLAAESFTLDSLEVAGHVVRQLESGSVDVFDYTSEAAGTTVNGILGYSFLRRFRVVVDYPSRRIAFQSATLTP